MGITLVLLSYNEIDGTKALLDKIPFDAVDEYFAVDGGSTDGTREYLTEKGIKIVDQKSKGRGEAFRIAFQEAKNGNLGFVSLDGNEDLDDIKKFRGYFDQGADMIIASRMMKESRNEEDDQFFKWRKWANNAFNLLINILWNRGPNKYIYDSINGFRGITRNAWEKMNPDGAGYTIEYQTTIRALKLKLKVAEFPTIEHDRIGGESYAKAIPTGIKFLKLLWHEILVGKRFKNKS